MCEKLMKYMFVSDIHGNVEILLEFFEVMKNDVLVDPNDFYAGDNK